MTTREKYADIIDLPHHISNHHPQMSNHDRAAQFAPFAALVGYDDDVKEAGRITQEEITLGEYQQQELNETLISILASIEEKPLVRITYFIPDKRKAGGQYICEEHQIRLIDEVTKTLITTKNKKIKLERVLQLEKI